MSVTFTVVWSRADGEQFTCRGLSPRVLVARLRKAIRSNSAPVTVHSIEPDKK